MAPMQLVKPVFDESIRLLHSRPALYSALIILPIAALLTGMGAATAYGEFHGADLPDRLLLTQDGGYSEWFEYLLTGTAGLAMLSAWSKTRIRAYLVLAVLFLFLTADNSLTIHENFGLWIAPSLEATGLIPNPRHYAEFAFMLLFGLVMLNVIVAAVKASEEQHRNRVLMIVALIACAAGFGVGLDMIDTIILTPGTTAVAISIFVEDAGELWCFSAIAVGAIAIFAQVRREEARQGIPAIRPPPPATISA